MHRAKDLYKLVALGVFLVAGCVSSPDPSSLPIHPNSIRSQAEYSQDVEDCAAQSRQALKAERPALSPQVAAFGRVGARMDRDIEQKKLAAKLRTCLEIRGYYFTQTAAFAPEQYVKDLLECSEQVQETPSHDASLVRVCMEARGHTVPW